MDGMDAERAVLSVEGLAHRYGNTLASPTILDGISFTVPRDRIVSLVGPSGCGKTTLLRCVSGLMPSTGGRVLLEGARIDGVPAGLAMVFQDYRRSLYPWMSIDANVEFPLVSARIKPDARRKRVDSCLAAVGLAGHGREYPWQLSGGMQQRAAIARALAYQPDVLLMDEPFASVDAQTRAELEDLVLRVRAEFRMSILFVTHDIDESVYLSDRIVVLSKCPTRIMQTLAV
ncbi:MAG TPA: ABC transporter ATP-binding protein, partial [Nevskiaceae bacterium]